MSPSPNLLTFDSSACLMVQVKCGMWSIVWWPPSKGPYDGKKNPPKQERLASGCLCLVTCPQERYTSWTFDLSHMRVSIISDGELNCWSAYILIYCVCKLRRSLSPAQKPVQMITIMSMNYSAMIFLPFPSNKQINNSLLTVSSQIWL